MLQFSRLSKGSFERINGDVARNDSHESMTEACMPAKKMNVFIGFMLQLRVHYTDVLCLMESLKVN